METKAFIEQKAFRKLISTVPNKEGGAYQDVDTIYRDMSRLVVVWLANTPASELQGLYAKFGWGGKANVRALRECARAWLQEHHADFLRS
jgi:hypothetical protein